MFHDARMRWLLLNHNLRGRGTWHRVWGIARELARRDEQVELWTAAPSHFYRSARELVEGVNIVETPSWAPLAEADDGWGPFDVMYRAARAPFSDCDVAYAFAHPPNNFVPAWLLKKVRSKALLYDWCDWYAGGIFPKREELRRAGLSAAAPKPLQCWAERRERALERALPRLADGVTVISEKLRELAIELGCAAERVLLLPNGAALADVKPLDRAACRSELNLPPTGEFLAYTANYHPDENFLLRALHNAAAKRPKLKLLKTGPPFSTSLIAELGLAARIIDFGHVAAETLPLILGAADALALPLENNASNIARLPFKFTEYLAAGRPVVTCRVGDVAVYCDRAAGTIGPIGLAAEAQIQSYGAALAAVFAPECDRAAMGRNARAFAESEFNWAELVRRILVHFQAVLPNDLHQRPPLLS